MDRGPETTVTVVKGAFRLTRTDLVEALKRYFPLAVKAAALEEDNVTLKFVVSQGVDFNSVTPVTDDYGNDIIIEGDTCIICEFQETKRS